MDKWVLKINGNKYQRLKMIASGGELRIYAGHIYQLNDSLYFYGNRRYFRKGQIYTFI